MNHDITHCSGQDVRLKPLGWVETCICQLRNTCKRHQAYKEIPKGMVVAMLMPLDCMDNDHNMYCENKQEENENS